MKVAVVHNRDRSGVLNVLGMQNRETYDPATITAVVDALENGGHNVALVDGNMHVIEQLRDFMPRVVAGEKPGMVFNMAYGIQGVSRYTHVPAMLEMLGVPYIGSNPQAHALALDKVVAKVLFLAEGLPTPRYWNFASRDDEFPDLAFPAVIKPKMEGMSIGISVAQNEEQLREAVAAVLREHKQHVLVEELIEGREFTVGVLGNTEVEVLPIVELDLEGDPKAIRNDEGRNPKKKICPARLPEEKAEEIHKLAAKAFRTLGLSDFSRLDLRMSSDGKPYILEINSMADLGRGGAYVLAAKAAGYSYDALINRIVDLAAVRYFGADHAGDAESAHRGSRAPTLSSRVHGYLKSQSTTIEDDLRGLVDRNTTEQNVDVASSQLSKLGFHPAQDPPVDVANVLYLVNHAESHNDVLLVANLIGSTGPSYDPYREGGNRLYGSGVAKSRGCVAVLFAALRALRFCRQLQHVRCGVLLPARPFEDQAGLEPLFAAVGGRSRRVLGVTPGDISGEVAVARAGLARFRIRIAYGRSELPLAPMDAAAAIGRLLVSLEKLEASAEGSVRIIVPQLHMTGTTHGLPARADADVIVRFRDPQRRERLEADLRKLAKAAGTDGLSFEVSGSILRPPMAKSERNTELFHELDEAAKSIHVAVSPVERWHSTEVCFVPDAIPTLDGLGPLGEARDGAEEYILRHSLVDRAALLALMIHRSGTVPSE